LLRAPIHHRDPFPCLTVDEALPAEILALLEALFEEEHDWEHHHGGFYECFLTEVSERLPADFSAALVERMAALLDQPLTSRVKVTLQRMEPGQQARVHTDRPLLGFEAARLIVQLQRGWEPGDGGVFCLHPDAAGLVTAWERPPRHNQGFGFVMGLRSFHSVSPVVRARRSVVFHFWHAGNSVELARQVRALFEGCRFDRLPATVVAEAAEAELRWPEEASYRAGLVAWVLHRWGEPEAVVLAGYREELEAVPPWVGEAGGDAVIGLARWVAELYAGEVSVEAWEGVRTRLVRGEVSELVGRWWGVCLGGLD
jgi:hypothetical protein